MFCPVCGKQISDDSKYCPNCGTLLEFDEDEEEREFRRRKAEFENQGKNKIRCKRCHQWIVPEGQYCPNCGFLMKNVVADRGYYFGDDDFQKSPQALRDPRIARRSFPVHLLIILMVIVIAIAIAVIFLFLRK